MYSGSSIRTVGFFAVQRMNAMIFQKLVARSSRLQRWRALSTELSSIMGDEALNNHSSNYKLVIIGSGWAGYKFFHECRKHRREIEKSVKNAVDVVIISKRNVRAMHLKLGCDEKILSSTFSTHHFLRALLSAHWNFALS